MRPDNSRPNARGSEVTRTTSGKPPYPSQFGTFALHRYRNIGEKIGQCVFVCRQSPACGAHSRRSGKRHDHSLKAAERTGRERRFDGPFAAGTSKREVSAPGDEPKQVSTLWRRHCHILGSVGLGLVASQGRRCHSCRGLPMACLNSQVCGLPRDRGPLTGRDGRGRCYHETSNLHEGSPLASQVTSTARASR